MPALLEIPEVFYPRPAERVRLGVSEGTLLGRSHEVFGTQLVLHDYGWVVAYSAPEEWQVNSSFEQFRLSLGAVAGAREGGPGAVDQLELALCAIDAAAYLHARSWWAQLVAGMRVQAR